MARYPTPSSWKRLLAARFANRAGQRILERISDGVAAMMGIGPAANVETSGERGLLRRLRATAAEPFCLFDVGANTGQYAALALRAFEGLDLVLHCFEPASAAYAELERGLSSHSGVRLNRLALGRSEGERLLHFDRPGSVYASLTPRRGTVDLTESEPVPVTTLDSYCSRHAIDRIDLLKLDVEGHELDVLAGASATFARGAVERVAFEFGACDIDTRSFLRDFHRFFEGVGMALFRLTPTGYCDPVGPYRETLERFRTTIFLAMKSR